MKKKVKYVYSYGMLFNRKSLGGGRRDLWEEATKLLFKILNNLLF